MTGPQVYDRSYNANADLSGKQFYPVKVTAKDVVDVGSAATDIAIGVLQDKPKQTEAGDVRVLGLTEVVVDGTVNGGIAAGDKLGIHTNGMGVKVTTNDRPVFAIAQEPATISAARISAILTPGAVYRTPA